MDLRTNYLGLELKNPLVPSASPMSRDLDLVRRLEDAGAGALVMYSLLEEEVHPEAGLMSRLTLTQNMRASEGGGTDSNYLAHSEEYVEQLLAIKAAVDIPVIASLNGLSIDGWVDYGKILQEAGADALELNVYFVAADLELSAEEVEFRYVQLLTDLQRQVSIPVSMKLAPYFSSIGNMVKRLERAGASGVVLFNRFYQPDIDLDTQSIASHVHLSRSEDSLIAMRWIAILHGQVNLSLAATGGVHTAEDALKMLAAGADITQLCSVLLKYGPSRLAQILSDMEDWLTRQKFGSLKEFRGLLSRQNVIDPTQYERAYFVRLLKEQNTPSG